MANPATLAIFNVQTVVQPDDAADLPRFLSDQRLTDAIYVGTAGDVVVAMQNNQVATYKNVASGTLLPLSARRVNATSTTALNLLALYVV